jgi:hypothetical protein
MGYNTECIIKKMEVEYSSGGLTNVIKTVEAALSGNYNGQHIQKTGTFTFKVPTPNPSSFIQYNSLSASDVVNFIKDTEQYKTWTSVLTSNIYKSMQTATQGICALPWE